MKVWICHASQGGIVLEKVRCTMQKTISIAVFFWLLLVPCLASAQDECADISDKLDFTCVIANCADTIEIRHCTLKKTKKKLCDSCATYKYCCGWKMCIALAGGDCEDGILPGGGGVSQILQGEEWHSADLATIYVPICTGRFVPLKWALRRVSRGEPGL